MPKTIEEMSAEAKRLKEEEFTQFVLTTAFTEEFKSKGVLYNQATIAACVKLAREIGSAAYEQGFTQGSISAAHQIQDQIRAAGIPVDIVPVNKGEDAKKAIERAGVSVH